MSFNELAGAPKLPLKFIPKYRKERWDKIPHIGYQTEKDNKKTIDQVRGPLNELIENLKIKKQKNPPVEDSDLPDALIFAMKETTGYRCMKEAENKLLVDNFIQHQYFQEFLYTLPYYYICDSRIVENLEKIAKENNFTFYIPEDDPKPKCAKENGSKKSVDKKEKCTVQFFCLITLDKSEIKQLKEKIAKVNLSTYYSAKDAIGGAPEQTQRQQYLPLFTEVWINSNNKIVDSFLRNIAKAEGENSNPYNFYFEKRRDQKEQTTKSDLSTKYIEAREKIDKFVKDSKKESFTLDDFWEKTTDTYDPNFTSGIGKEREDFLALLNLSKCPSLLGLSWILLHKLVFKLSAKRKELLYGKLGGLITPLINLQIDAGKKFFEKTDYHLAIQFSKIMLKSLFSDALRIRYQFEMESFIFLNNGSGIARADSEEVQQPTQNFTTILEKNGVKRPEEFHGLKFSPETLVKRCETYKTVAFVRGTAQPTDDIAVLREWGSNATVASGGDKTFYLLQVFSLVKWLITQEKKIEHIVGHSRGAGIAYNAAMIYNYIFKSYEEVKPIKFCGLDGAVTLPVLIRVPRMTSDTTTETTTGEIKPDSIFSRNINMASVLDGALLDPLGEQERVYPNCKPTTDGDESEDIKSILSDILPFDFSDAATLRAIYFSFTEQKNQGIGHDAGTAGTGYRLELENKIKEKIKEETSDLSWIDVATGFKRDLNAFKKGTWPEAEKTDKYKEQQNDGERYKELIFFHFKTQEKQKNLEWVFMKN